MINAHKSPFVVTHIRPKRGKQESVEAMKLADCDDGRVLFRVRNSAADEHGSDLTTITSAARFAATFVGV